MKRPRLFRILTNALFIAGIVAAPLFASAQGDVQGPAPPPGMFKSEGIITDHTEDGCAFASGDIQKECLNVIIANAIDVLFGFAGALCLLNVIIAGYQIGIGNVTGSGDTAGKDRLRWSLIGLFMTICTFAIINAALSAIA